MDLRERSEHQGRHPWERARARYFGALVAEHTAGCRIARLLDVGAGDDWLARELLHALGAQAEVVGWDVHYTPEDLAAPAPAGLSRTAMAPAGTFDVVTALDVLEHVDDEDAFLRDQVAARLAPGGIAVVSVPAYQALFGDHDRMLEHRRRYRPAVLRATVGRHLRIIDQGSLFTSLLLPRLVQAGLERAGRHGDATGVGAWTGGPRLTALLERVLLADAAAGRRLGRWGWPVPGLSTWVVAVGAQS